MLIEATTQTTLGNVYILTGEDDLHVGADVTLRCTYTDPETHTGADAIIAWTGTHSITVEGTVHGADEAINLVGCLTAQTVTITAGGRLYGGGDGVVSDADGVILDGLGSTLSNAGRIEAWGSAVSLIVPDAGTTTITNSGTMYGRVSGIWHKFGNGVLQFTNTGVVESPAAAFLGGESADIVVNRGSMIGAVSLGGGSDLYDGRGGSVTGAVLGGGGDDRLICGHQADHFDGGEGFDHLDLGELRGSVVIDLAAPAGNSGTAVVGDSFTAIERISTGSGNDRLSGDALANEFGGGAGSDSLAGGAGDDTLAGGAGRDLMTGDAGADRFVFLSAGGKGDFITDFASGEDRIALDAAAFGYGAATGSLPGEDFVTATSRNGALDSSDHFVFRTTDGTLWYDPDGAGGARTLLIATLGAGSLLSFADIELF